MKTGASPLLRLPKSSLSSSARDFSSERWLTQVMRLIWWPPCWWPPVAPSKAHQANPPELSGLHHWDATTTHSFHSCQPLWSFVNANVSADIFWVGDIGRRLWLWSHPRASFLQRPPVLCSYQPMCYHMWKEWYEDLWCATLTWDEPCNCKEWISDLCRATSSEVGRWSGWLNLGSTL